MSNKSGQIMDRFGDPVPKKERRSSKKSSKERRRASDLSSSSSSPSVPAWRQGMYVPHAEEEKTTPLVTAESPPPGTSSAVGVSQQESTSFTENQAFLDDALVTAFLEVMPDKSRDYALQVLKEANNNVEQALLLSMEGDAQQEESAQSPKDEPVKAFLEVMPDKDREFALEMLQRTDDNVQRAILLAMEESEPTEMQCSSSSLMREEGPVTTAPETPPRMSPSHQASLTASDLQVSGRFMESSSESMRFMAQFEDEVPMFRDYDSPPPSPPRKHEPAHKVAGAPKSSMRHSGTSHAASSVRFSDDRRHSSVPNGAKDNLDALQKMARVATATKQASTRELDGREAPVKRRTVHVGWNEKIFVVGDEQQSPSSPRPHSPPNRSASPPPDEPLVPEHRESFEARMHSSLPKFDYSGPTPSLLAPKRKNTLIVDKEKRDTRWQWAQALVSKSFKPYRAMLSQQDDLLPDEDEFKAFEASGAKADEDFENVRDAMLDDYDLTEREVAAFFEGFALFHVKVRSLQSQLESLKAAKRAAEPRSIISMHKSFSALSSRNSTGEQFQAFCRSTTGMAMSPTGDPTEVDSPRMFGESLRVLSMKKVQADHNDNAEVQRLLKELEEADKKQKKLEKQLHQAGVIIAEDIPYEEAKSQVQRIAKRMGEIGSSEVTHPDKAEQTRLREEYFKLEQEMEKYNAALMLTDEYIEEQEELELKWEEDHEEENLEALKKLRRHMPVNVKSMSEAELSSMPSPNGKVLPKTIAKKFKRTNVLQLIRTDPDDLARMHPSSLENLRVTGLTLTERRAIYAHIKDIGPRWKAMQADKMTERKWTWFKMMKLNFKENLDMYEHHIQQYGPPENHPYATRDNPSEGCPLLGKQCPLKADKQIDYDGDYGYTEEAKYEVFNVRKSDKEDPGAKAKREAMELARDKKANERSIGLKKHYKGKVLQVSQANGSCENMDEMLDRIEILQTKWIEERLSNEGELSEDDKRKELTAFAEALNELKLGVLHIAERSGMQLTGKKDANADNPDKRSPIELGLCEEVYDSCVDFFAGIKARMKEISISDNRLKCTIEQLRELLDELHERNLATLKELDCKRPAPSRKHKTYKELTKEAKAKAAFEKTGTEETGMEEVGPPRGAGDRGGLVGEIVGRGGAPGRGGLMDAIKAGRGGREPGGRGGLMDAIKAGRGGRGRGPPGDLMSAIKGRERGEPGRGPAAAGLMDAIRQRGQENKSSGQRDGGRGRGAPGGRCDLLSQIAGRGKIE